MSHHRDRERFRGRNRRVESVVCSGIMINRILAKLERIVTLLEGVVPADNGKAAVVKKLKALEKRVAAKTARMSEAIKVNTPEDPPAVT